MSAAGAKIMSAPLYIGGDLHGNVGHNMLDSVFPAISNLARLHAALAADAEGSSKLATSLPDVRTGNFTYLLIDPPPCCPGWHRGKKERAWTGQLSGGIIDLDELASACPPPGCLIRTAWVGAGHVGLCAVDDRNIISGSREHRALFRFRERIYLRWGVSPTPLPRAPGGGVLAAAAASAADSAMAQVHGSGLSAALPLVLVVQTKRIVSNLASLVELITATGTARAQLIKWETMSFAEQLAAMRSAAVQVSGVGSAQINHFLLPQGSVAVCLGWRDELARSGIHYFDHHVLRSMDHVRTVYYPSYSLRERAKPKAITLDLDKAMRVIGDALAIYRKGFSTPLPADANANHFDHAYEELNRLTASVVTQMRTNDYDWRRPAPRGCTNMNGIEEVLWDPSAGRKPCPWQQHVPKLLVDFGL